MRRPPLLLIPVVVLGVVSTAVAELEPAADAGAPVPLGEPEVPVEVPPPAAAAIPAFDPDAPPPPGWRLMVSDLTVLRLNPIGLETRGRFGLQRRLYRSTRPVTRNNFAFAGLYPKLNPASAQLGLGGELQPASVFNVRALAEVQQFFGTFGFLQSFGSATANYSDQTLNDLKDDPARPPRAARMFHASLQPLLQLKVGPIAVRALLQLDYWDFAARGADPTAYEATFDTLLPDRGWTVSTDTDVLYTGRRGLAVGLRHSSVTPLYKPRHFADRAEYDAYAGENAHSRLGLFGAYTFRDTGPSRFNKPTVVLIVSWYLSHRWRLGEPATLPVGGRADDYTSRAFPYLLVGFAFESDLLEATRAR